MKKTIRFLGLGMVLGGLSVAGCAGARQDQKLDDKVAGETAVQNRSDLRTESAGLIESATDLSADQKSRLGDLRATTAKSLDDISQRSLKLRAVLIQDVVSRQYDAKEVELIKSRLRKVEDERLSVIFGAVTKANKILGRHAEVNQRMIEGILVERPGGSRD